MERGFCGFEKVVSRSHCVTSHEPFFFGVRTQSSRDTNQVCSDVLLDRGSSSPPPNRAGTAPVDRPGVRDMAAAENCYSNLPQDAGDPADCCNPRLQGTK